MERTRTPHVDLWMSNTTDPAVQDCEAALTPDDPDTIIVNPPTDLPVDPRPLFAAVDAGLLRERAQRVACLRWKSAGRKRPSASLPSISSRLAPVRSGMRKYTKSQAATLNAA